MAENEAAAHHRWWAAALVSQLSGLPPNLADRLHHAHAVEHGHVGQGVHTGLEDVLGELVAHDGTQLLGGPWLADVVRLAP